HARVRGGALLPRREDHGDLRGDVRDPARRDRERAPPRGPGRMSFAWDACYSAATPSEAHLVKGFLEQRGVPCLLRSEGPTIYPPAAVGMGVAVLVPQDWLAVARKLVARRASRRRAPRVVPFRRKPTR